MQPLSAGVAVGAFTEEFAHFYSSFLVFKLAQSSKCSVDNIDLFS